ncbi:hypothetical protein AB6P12_00935 [Streptococcus mutans]|uniref:hypothetical protein n=1 Tax=Streptococcus mutans TaxID=1309 RepID=UPI0002B55A05|nr:hypothetical protein [Streptococcus mutans]EMC49523.1 hypothetical protein SMU104_07855 [Streptococcus mutans SA41]
MSLFNWFKKTQAPQNFESGLSLTSQKGDLLNPNSKEVEEAIVSLSNDPEGFVTLSWTSVSGDFSFIQALCFDGSYLIEYRTADLKKGYVYRKPNVPIKETLQFFRSFLENQTLTLDADWLQVKAY